MLRLMVNTETYLAAFDADTARSLDVARGAIDAQIPSCPDWDVAQMLQHLGQVYNFITAAVEAAGTDDRPAPAQLEVPEDAMARIDWLAELQSTLAARLRDTDPETPAWNWAGTGTAGFFHRRMAHEALVHRWDIETAADAVTPIDSDLGADGVDEVLFVGMQHSTNPDKVFTYPDGSLHLHRTDGDGEWLATTDGSELIVTREHAKGDVAVRGSGDNLLLYIWGRGGEGLEIFGDEALAEAWTQVAP